MPTFADDPSRQFPPTGGDRGHGTRIGKAVWQVWATWLAGRGAPTPSSRHAHAHVHFPGRCRGRRRRRPRRRDARVDVSVGVGCRGWGVGVSRPPFSLLNIRTEKLSDAGGRWARRRFARAAPPTPSPVEPTPTDTSTRDRPSVRARLALHPRQICASGPAPAATPGRWWVPLLRLDALALP